MISCIKKTSLLLSTALSLAAMARAQGPVQWDCTATKINASTYEVHLKASIADGWHIYAQEQPKEAIAIPTKITLKANPLVAPVGKAQEVGKKEIQKIDALDIEQFQYGHSVEFVQKVTLKAAVKTTLAATVTFQACNDHQCLPPKEETFTLSL